LARLNIVSLYKKLRALASVIPEIWMGHPKFKTCHVTQPRLFQGRFVVRRLGLATVNLYTKYEVSMFTHHEDMTGDEKFKNGVVRGLRGHPRSLETSPFDRVHMTSYSTLIETIHLSCTVFTARQLC